MDDNETNTDEDLCAFQTMADVTSRPLSWVWDGLIPRGKVTMIAGEPGSGKSLLALQVATSVTKGRLVPVPPPELEEQYPPDPQMLTSPAAVVLLTANDDPGDTIKPRLEAAGADLNRIYLLRNPATLVETTVASSADSLQLNRDLTRLETNLRQLIDKGVDIRLIIIDPIDSYLSTVNKNVDRTAIVARLVKLAAWTDAAVLVVASSNSSQSDRARFRTITGAHRELAHAARSILMVAPHLDKADERVVMPLKLCLCESRAGISFLIKNGVVHWSQEPFLMSSDIYSQQSREKAKNPLIRLEQSTLNRATEWLYTRLKAGEDLSARIQWDAHECEISYGSLRRAFKKLGGIATKLDKTGKWLWRLPQEMYSSHSIAREIHVEEMEKTKLHFVYQWRGNQQAVPPTPPLVPLPLPCDLEQHAQGAQELKFNEMGWPIQE